MTVLCWNTTWISVHSSDYSFFNFLLHLRAFFNRGFKNKNKNNKYYKLAVLVFRCLNGLASRYLSNHIGLQRVAEFNRRCLRSSSSSLLVVRRTRLATVGDCAFPVAGSRVWNSVPRDVTSDQLKLSLFFESASKHFCSHVHSLLNFDSSVHHLVV